MKYRQTIRMDQFRQAGISIRMNNDEASLRQVPQLWERFFKEAVLQQLTGSSHGSPVYEAYYDYDSDASGNYTLMLGTRVDDSSPVPEAMSDKSIPMATYAVFDVDGPDQIKDAWKEIWKNKHLKRTFTGDFEIIQGDSVRIYVATEN